ncbi:hypothetical protein [Brachybacterium paraconglomeratum]|uniref:hypothetical protein n=1 Tax=Brachybacterium paraconglomeratum TaxID=173362 RepID=UPI0022AEE568|nr:hypothetical protein [Brachybacterium paraconglomeratum]MCZ4325681.1 hypothetical protein [Brachybacterium paraconglomeratum]
MSAPTIDVARVGAQRPRISRVPEHTYSSGADAVDFMRLTGTEPDEWQEWVLEQALAERADGRFLPLEVGLIVPRQNGKNYVLEARMLSGVFVFGETQIIYSAMSLKTARKAHRALVQLIRRTPFLLRRVLGYKRGQAAKADMKGIKSSGIETSIEFDNGAKIEFVTRTKDTVRGFTGDLVIIDEAYEVSADEIAAMLPTMAALTAEGSPQVWYTSSGPRAGSDFLRQLRARAEAPEGRERLLCYMEWSTDPDIETDVLKLEFPTEELVEALYEANPGAGRRITLEYMLEAEWGGMSDTNFRVERLGIPVPIGSDDFIPSPAWTRCRDDELIAAVEDAGEVEQGLRDVRLAVDVAPDRSRAAIGLAGVRGDGRVHLEVVDQGDGVDWVPAAAHLLWRANPGFPILVQMGSSAEDLVADIRRAGAPARPITLREYAAACGRLLDGIKGRQVAHVEQESLDAAVRAARPSYKGDTRFIWKRSHALADITPLVTVTLAANQALKALQTDQSVPEPDDPQDRPATRGGRLLARRPRAERMTRSR